MIEDYLYKFKEYYNESPQEIKQILGRIYRILPLSIRYGKVYLKYAKLLKESQWWSKKKLEEYQWRKLEALLKHAYENVPYYRRILDERGIKPKHIQNFDDFRKLPFLTKEIVRDNLQDLVARSYPKYKLLYVTTGGSTGIPLGLYYEKGVARSKELAFMTTQWGRVGYKIGDKLAMLMGNVVHGANEGKCWEYEPIKNRLILSSYHMTDKNLLLYVKQIRKFKPRFLHGYPSTLTILANFMKKNRIESFESVEAVLAGSENMYPWQFELFKEIFHCKIFFWYGLTELSALAGTCEKSHYYHVFPEYSYVELLDSDNNPVSKEDGVGEIVGTTFDNDIMPLIRYRTQDLAVYTKQKCECGRNYPLLKRIDGRKQELVVTKGGSLVSLTALFFSQYFFFKAFGKIKNMQLEQSKRGEVLLRIVKDKGYGIADEKEIRANLMQVVGGDLDISFDYVDEIPRTQSGKHRFLIQKLPINLEDMKL